MGASLFGLSLKSSIFENQSEVSCEYACCGRGVSPELSWTDSPENTASFALKITDQTTSEVYWFICNIPKETSHLSRNFNHEDLLLDGILEGVNDFGGVGYKPLCAPLGEKHFYIFDLFALDVTLGSQVVKDRLEREKQLKKHTIDHSQLNGFLQVPLHPTAPNSPLHDPRKKQDPNALPNSSYP